MATTLLKPRWTAWENICIREAFTHKIQYKIMAIALDRTISSINKKIQKLGLRVPSSVRGRVKGQKQLISTKEKIPYDLSKMTNILEEYAPIEFFQKATLNLQKWTWSQPQFLLTYSPETKEWNNKIAVCDVPFTLINPMEFLPSNPVISSQNREQKFASELTYTSLRHMEKWANMEGFHKLNGTLEKNGLSYWKNGTYFSKTQLLMHVNRLRYNQNLQPIVLLEEEEELLT